MRVADRDLPRSPRVAKDGAKAGGRVPLVGIGLAAVGVGLDIASGTDPLKAVASGAAGVAGGVVGGVIGAAAGASIGGAITGPAAPVGAAVGGIVGGFIVGSVASGAVEQAYRGPWSPRPREASRAAQVIATNAKVPRPTGT